MSSWFYTHHERAVGPIDGSTMRGWVKDRSLHPSHLVRKEGETEWRTAESYPELWVPGKSADAVPSAGVAARPLPNGESGGLGSKGAVGTEPAHRRQMTPNEIAWRVARLLITSATGLGLALFAAHPSGLSSLLGDGELSSAIAQIVMAVEGPGIGVVYALCLLLATLGLNSWDYPEIMLGGAGLTGLLAGLLVGVLWIWLKPPHLGKIDAVRKDANRRRAMQVLGVLVVVIGLLLAFAGAFSCLWSAPHLQTQARMLGLLNRQLWAGLALIGLGVECLRRSRGPRNTA